MAPFQADSPRSPMEVCGPRASSVIVHRVPPDSAESFLEWQRGITAAAESFSGYQGTDVYPPADRRQQEWVVVLHFLNAETLQHWLDSPARSEWTAKLPGGMGDFRLRTLPAGFGPWFAGLVRGPGGGLPPSWKMALTVLLGLYPTVMLLTLTVGPYLSPLGLAVSMLIGNALSVSLLQWGVMPALEVVLRPWLHADGSAGKARSAAGAAVVVLVLGGLALLFRQVTG